MGALLGRLAAARRAEQALARGVPLGCLARLVQASGGTPAAAGSGRRAAPAVPGLVAQLTRRELEGLAMLAAGTPHQAIAGALFVPLSTGQKHVTHVLAKLRAPNPT